jgi:dynein heavy chain
MAQEIKARVLESVKIEREIDSARDAYRPLAIRAQVIYFSILDLSPIDAMYQFSLNWFKDLFRRGLTSAKLYKTFNERIAGIMDAQTQLFYETIVISLLEKHKLIFQFILCQRIQ